MADSSDSMAIFAPAATRALGEAVARKLGRSLAVLEERRFDGGEFKIRPLESVRGRNVYVIQSLFGDVTGSACDRLCELLFFSGALRDAGAARVCAVMPHLAFARKDRRTKARDPITTRYVAQMIEAIGIEHVMAAEVHNPAAFDNAHRVPADHLTTTRLFADHFASAYSATDVAKRPLAVVSPDLGGAKRAQLLRESLMRRLGFDIEFACVEKRRTGGVVSGGYLTGSVEGRTVILLDDLISSGGTLVRAARICRAAGAIAVHAAATHATFAAEAAGVLADAALNGIVVTDTVRISEQATRTLAGKLTVLPIAGLIAAAIDCLQGHGSLSSLLELE
jgi:ribose-phosphate pyrophosphokinase